MSSEPEQDPIEQYLDAVCEHFKMLPPDVVTRNRQELSNHIDAAVADRITDGVSRSGTVEEVLKRFGPAEVVGKKIGQASVQAWLWEISRQNRKAEPKWVRRASLVPIALFGAISPFCQHTPSLMPVCLCLGMVVGAINAASAHIASQNGRDRSGLCDMIERGRLNDYRKSRSLSGRLINRFVVSAIASLEITRNPMRGLNLGWWIRSCVWLAIVWLLPSDYGIRPVALALTLFFQGAHVAQCLTLAVLQRRSSKA